MSKNICPFMSSPLKSVKCIEHDCMLWTQVQGTHPQTGEQLNRWSCAIAWIPTLLLEVAARTRGVAATIDASRDEVVDGNRKIVAAAFALAGEIRATGALPEVVDALPIEVQADGTI